MFLKERWHRFGWEDLGEVENTLVGGVGTQSGDLSSEKFVSNDVLFRQVSPASIHCFTSLRLTCHLLTQILLPKCTILISELGCGSKLCYADNSSQSVTAGPREAVWGI